MNNHPCYRAWHLHYSGSTCKMVMLFLALAGYSYSDVIQCPFKHPLGHQHLTASQKAFNKSMSRVRIAVEWCFKEICYTWKQLTYKPSLRVGTTPVAALYLIAADLTNMRYRHCSCVTLPRHRQPFTSICGDVQVLLLFESSPPMFLLLWGQNHSSGR